ncbi:polysaccharide deacetylase family protein [Oceanicoccus sp. KOV_DT_Chl]|uniref:polysaccharide deacetylase family protein n=1 Tax=Oceanicoccus sp. KOV_DT_Chl TaxID=1904639 RepID=UPI000C7E8244|nr:polysaccharide deacetylase family protein [Oceanicoccus sp. KOV_DT_Chl]
MTLNKTTIKKFLRYCVSQAYYITNSYKRANNGKVIVLMYHRVLKDNDNYASFIQPGMYVYQSTFKLQMEFLSKHYKIISMPDLLSMMNSNEIDNKTQYCVITFDDGWRDNYQYAYPIMREQAIPATIFLAESYIGTNQSFWHEKLSRLFYLYSINSNHVPSPDRSSKNKDGPLYCLEEHLFSKPRQSLTIDSAIEALKKYENHEIEQAINTLALSLNIPLNNDNDRDMLNWEEIDEMGKANIAFGSHTCGHKILTNISTEEAEQEIHLSAEKLSIRNVNYTPVFCYPNGRYNENIRELVIKAGYQAAVSTKLGSETLPLADKFGIKRIGLHDDITYNMPLFSYRLK